MTTSLDEKHPAVTYDELERARFERLTTEEQRRELEAIQLQRERELSRSLARSTHRRCVAG